ncbi:tyrosine--tRNA ligase [Candidatus Roizmanbacteria bacterium CG09_land_8_20_14_0_10_41_9]|uniref:Tyrosine--tRNA ligase n=1 Tax=Candidatus Roizmanbacteria bacterium CG09_land_8_20_14_0_10_41_9 TaxID=1974850 RepID=A0A2H0WTY9_9BACT|nr:MAG: tyrosine--tRNA ligase [Candidatus Roizmanbacteria bacterium CG09_land_8_20_14_0_10_41_9]
MNSFVDELTWRGLIYQKTPGIEAVFKKGTTLYIGFDPTAPDFHIGHLVWISFLQRALMFGQNIIVIAGGGTALIGDPGGKDEERPILPKEIIEKNKELAKKQLSRFIQFDGKRARMVDNSEWIEKLTLVDFLRDTGKYMSVNSMLDKEAIKTRITRQEGISYAEFSYQLLQAYDFLLLYQKYHCEVQIGGSDQWGNIVQGVELVRKKTGKQAYGLSFPLIVNPNTGKKFGKTEKGAAIWLNKEKTHPFAFYQFFINIEDELVPSLMKVYSFKTHDEITKLISLWENEKQNRILQKELAYELTELVHGKNIADQCKRVASLLFEKGTSELSEADVEFIKTSLPYKKISSEKDFVLEQALIDLGLTSSKGEARRLVEQNGVKTEKLFGKYHVIRKGKKEYGIIEVA